MRPGASPLLSLAAVRVPADLDRAPAFLLALTWPVFLVSAAQLQAAQPLSPLRPCRIDRREAG